MKENDLDVWLSGLTDVPRCALREAGRKGAVSKDGVMGYLKRGRDALTVFIAELTSKSEVTAEDVRLDQHLHEAALAARESKMAPSLKDVTKKIRHSPLTMQAIRDRAMELAIEQAADRTLDKCKKMAKNDPPPDNPDQYMLDIFFEVRAFKVLPARLVYIDPETKKPKSWSPAYGIAKDFEETSKLLKAVEAANELLKPLRAIHGDLPAAELWAKRDEVPPPERAAKKKSKAPVVPPGTSTADGDKKSKASGD